MKTIEERARDLYNMLPLIQESHIDTIARALRDAMRCQKSIDTRKVCDWFKQTHEYWLDDNGIYDMDAALDAFREVMEEQL